MTREQLIAKCREIGPWFHQIDLGDGVFTRSVAPRPGPQPQDHPQTRWRKIKDVMPADMRGMRVLDVGCSDGFFSIEMAKRGAEVFSVDASRHAVRKLRWLRDHLKLPNIQVRYQDIYRLHEGLSLGDRFTLALRRRLWQLRYLLSGRTLPPPKPWVPRHFDFVLMFALLYHVKEPLLALEQVVPYSEVLLIETIAVDDEMNSHLKYHPPQAGVTVNPKWHPTTRCLKDMLGWAGYDHILELASARDDQRPIYLAWKEGADLGRWNLPQH